MKSKHIVILGGGISGIGSAILAQKKGLDVFLSDSGSLSTENRATLTAHNILFEEGGHTEAKILTASEVIKSPGIPDKAPIVKSLLDKNIPVISEIEFAGRYTDARTICITGSNGKTTTTTLTYQMLLDAGFNVGLGGNIGESFALQVATTDRDWYVLELSSFQLDGMKDFRADIAVLLNITPDHLDRYNYSLELYAASKMQITRNQRPNDTFIYCADDPVTARMLTQHELPTLRLSFSGSDNFQAASLAALAAGVPEESIAKTIKNFKTPEHRLQSLGEFDGVEWINDSKATNVDSVRFAFERMKKPVIWIAGGTDKGNDYEPLYQFTPNIRALVCMGLNNEKLVHSFRGRIDEIHSTSSLDDALTRARKLARPGDVVLLSPACASFDLFKNYEDRGKQFSQWIKNQKN